jgi:hypothetical protein
MNFEVTKLSFGYRIEGDQKSSFTAEDADTLRA